MDNNITGQIGGEKNIILKIVAIASVITALGGAYYFFINNIWKPKVNVINADFNNGFATIEIPFGKKIDIYGDSEFLIGGDWGVRFGTISLKGKRTYENLQLLKKGLVVEYLDISKIK